MLYHVDVVDVHALVLQDLADQVQQVLLARVFLLHFVEELAQQDVQDLAQVYQHLLLADVGAGSSGFSADGDDGVGLVVVADQEGVQLVARVVLGVELAGVEVYEF